MEVAVNQGNDELLTVREFSAFLKVPLSWVYSRTREKGPGTLPRLMCGRYVRIPKQAAVRWLENQQEAGAQ